MQATASAAARMGGATHRFASRRVPLHEFELRQAAGILTAGLPIAAAATEWVGTAGHGNKGCSKMRLEIFVNDLELSTSFYIDVLRFTLEGDANSDYRELMGHDSRISLHPISKLGTDHPLNQPGRLGLGLELVLEVDGLAALFEHVPHEVADRS